MSDKDEDNPFLQAAARWAKMEKSELILGKAHNPDAVDAMIRACVSFDYKLLAERIRNGSAGADERDLAARILEGQHKPPKRRPRSLRTIERNLEIFRFVRELREEVGKLEIAYEMAAKHFKTSETTIRNAYRDIGTRYFEMYQKDEF